MARAVNRLSALSVGRMKSQGRYADGGGLYLQVFRNGSRSWIFRYMLRGAAREMGLGSLNDVPLADARKRAAECRRIKSEGTDPIEARHSKWQAAKLEAARALTFEQCAEAYIEAHRPSWRNAKHAAQWKSTLKAHAYPVFGSLSVQSVDTALVMKVLEPLWAKRPSTAARLRGRMECILDWAKAKGHRTGENPAIWRGHLANMLPRVSKLRKVKHHSAMPYAEVGAFMRALLAQEGTAASALRFLILTATRTSETILARWEEIDLERGVWTIPAERMKAGKAHRVPLSAAAKKLLENLPRDAGGGDFVFIGSKKGKPLSNMAMLALLQRMGFGHITVHGFRSTFRDWAAEETSYPDHVVEMALAHTISNKVEAAYRRGDLLLKRQKLMEDWAKQCAKVAGPAKVLPFKRGA